MRIGGGLFQRYDCRTDQSLKWVDAATRVVMVEMVLYAASVRQFAYVTLVRVQR